MAKRTKRTRAGDTAAGDASGADASGAGVASDEAGPDDAPVFDGGGTYRRDETGTWRYTVGGDVVPGARDLRLGETYRPEHDLDGDGRRIVPRHWVGLRPGHPLAWVRGYGELGTREPYLVPDDEWEAHADDIIGMLAPELHPARLVGVDEVASIAGISEVTVRAYVHRKQMPQPVTRVGGSPVWSRPVIERWLRRRSRARRGPAEIGAGSGFPSPGSDG